MAEFLILLLIIFVIFPLIKVAVTIYRARRQMRNVFEQFRQTGRAASERPEPKPAPRRKKIDPADGEFVAFEELPPDNAAQQTVETETIVVEQQIVDAEWEDIK